MVELLDTLSASSLLKRVGVGLGVVERLVVLNGRHLSEVERAKKRSEKKNLETDFQELRQIALGYFLADVRAALAQTEQLAENVAGSCHPRPGNAAKICGGFNIF